MTTQIANNNLPEDPNMSDKKLSGVLIINLGSPASTKPKDIGRFLNNFLSDQRVVSWPKALWLPILRGIVVPIRPKKSKPLYESIWLDEGSPLTVYTKRQQKMLAEALPDVVVRYAMAYSRPRIFEVLQEFEDLGVTDLEVVPLYPQYAPSTVAAITDQIFAHYQHTVHVPNLRIHTQFHLAEAYISWYADQLIKKISETSTRFDRVVFSFHGVPNKPVQGPNKYRKQCEETVGTIVQRIRDAGIEIEPLVTFQSKFGPGEWLKPATITTMAKLPKTGVKSVLVCTPGFISDCIETLDEIVNLNQEEFKSHGGKHFAVVKPINDDPVFVTLIKDLIGAK